MQIRSFSGGHELRAMGVIMATQRKKAEDAAVLLKSVVEKLEGVRRPKATFSEVRSSKEGFELDFELILSMEGAPS